MTEAPAPDQILLVDDNPANLDLLSRVLRPQGYRIRTALSGRLALESARLSAPDLILLDITMPEMSGFEVCELLKRDEKLRTVPVIFISALDDVLDKVKAFNVGGADYVTKPFHAEEVIARAAYQIELRRLRQQLEDRNRVLAESYASLQELERLKAGFTAMLVHDLRSPLAGIKTVLELYEEEGTIKPAHLTHCRQAIQNIVGMLNDLMELFRSEAGEIPLNKRPTSPRELLETLCSAFSPQAEHRNIRLEYACPDGLPDIDVDPQQVNRILSNLVGNAMKYTPSGGRIHLDASTVEGGGVDLGLRWLQISVTDNGQGIPADQLPYVFDPYRQASKRDASVGFGLGLAIVQRLMAAHKGRVSVRSQVGVGSTFSMNFPLNR